MTATIKENLVSMMLLWLAFATCSCNLLGAKQPSSDAILKVSAFATGSGWGYQIYKGNRIFIRQPFVPGLSGKRSFASPGEAIAVGNLVRDRMYAGNPMPVVTQADLATLRVAVNQPFTIANH